MQGLRVGFDEADGCVSIENRVESLLLLVPVAQIGIAFLPEYMSLGRPCEPTPGPEIAPGKNPARTGIVEYPIEYRPIIKVAAGSRRIRGEQKTVPGHSKFFHDHRLTQCPSDGAMVVNVLHRVCKSRGERTGNVFFVDPAPIVGPTMNVDVIDVGIAMHPAPKLDIVFRTLAPLRTRTDQVVGDRASGSRRLPPASSRQRRLCYRRQRPGVRCPPART